MSGQKYGEKNERFVARQHLRNDKHKDTFSKEREREKREKREGEREKERERRREKEREAHTARRRGLK